jgi:hypothetical protein
LVVRNRIPEKYSNSRRKATDMLFFSILSSADRGLER